MVIARDRVIGNGKANDYGSGKDRNGMNTKCGSGESIGRTP